jgi:hypothetical protein
MFRIRNPVPCGPLDPGSWIEKNPDPGSVINISDHISESLVSFFGVKILFQFNIADSGWKIPNPGWKSLDSG